MSDFTKRTPDHRVASFVTTEHPTPSTTEMRFHNSDGDIFASITLDWIGSKSVGGALLMAANGLAGKVNGHA